ncbi:MAG: 30S ribosomal protein S15 [Chloroflexota bacterium]
MSIDKDVKTTIIEKHARHDGDTGSPEVQIALLTERIQQLTRHMQEHKHDQHSRRGLLKLVGQRRRQLKYLSRTRPDAYRALIKELGLRR